MLGPLAFSQGQNFAAGYHAPSLKLRPHNSRAFPAKGDNILLQSSGHIPLGADNVRLTSASPTDNDNKEARRATIMASLEAPELGNITVFEHKGHHYVVNQHGDAVRSLPSRLTFRITASSLVEIADRPFDIESRMTVPEFLKTLSFTARIFRASNMDCQVVHPASVRNVGIPLDIAAAERVYRASFDVGPLSVEDHVVLEVTTPDGAPVSKFFVQLK